jgi:hypothetical protein
MLSVFHANTAGSIEERMGSNAGITSLSTFGTIITSITERKGNKRTTAASGVQGKIVPNQSQEDGDI